MYYEEEVIDGILCHRGTPDGDWVPLTLEALTIALTTERGQSKRFHDAWYEVCQKLDAIRAVMAAPY